MLTKRTLLAIAFIALAVIAVLVSCEKGKQTTESTSSTNGSPYQFEATGEDYLISALDEIQSVADWNGKTQQPARSFLPPFEHHLLSLAKASVDTVIVYGAVTPEGYGATITERYTHPKGLLLISVRKSYGKGNGRVVTETKRYISLNDFENDNPQQSNVTEVFGLSRDTIVTHVLRNGTLETYTFRLPVVTRTVNPQDGSVKVSSRFALNGMVVTEVRDGNGVLSQTRKTYGQPDGSLITRTEYADASWRQVRTLGRLDGSILREVTSSK